MSAFVALCDLSVVPVSYDFITWLVRAKFEAARANCDRLHVWIAPHTSGRGGVGRYWNEYDDAETVYRLQHIVLPACHLAGATVTYSPLDFPPRNVLPAATQTFPQTSRWHHAAALVDAVRRGETLPTLSASEHALRLAHDYCASQGPRPVTITLRNTPPHERDSAWPEWERAIVGLVDRGFQPIILPDTRDALVTMAPAFAVDLDLRVALYQTAALNLHVHSGAGALCWYTNAPHIMFGACLPEEKWREHWRKHLHIEWGEQLPWFGRHQRLVYEPDTAETILREVDRWAGATS